MIKRRPLRIRGFLLGRLIGIVIIRGLETVDRVTYHSAVVERHLSIANLNVIPVKDLVIGVWIAGQKPRRRRSLEFSRGSKRCVVHDLQLREHGKHVNGLAWPFPAVIHFGIVVGLVRPSERGLFDLALVGGFPCVKPLTVFGIEHRKAL